MANRLKMAIRETIQAFYQRGWSQRRIARELDVDRGTVARYVRGLQDEAKPANAPHGSLTESPDPKPANAPQGSPGSELEPKPANAPHGSDRAEAAAPTAAKRRGRQSLCETWRAVIEDKLAIGLSAQRIRQDLCAEHGFAGSYYTVRRFVRKLECRSELPVRRLEREPGEEAQVDFGTGAWLVGPDGKRRKTHVLRVILSYSRKGYSEVVTRQTTDNFLRCLENALHHFRGSPRHIVLDNLRAAVKKADWFEPELNPKVASFAEHYGIVFLPTRPYKPQHKGKVEKGIDYVQSNALKGRTFASEQEQNLFLLEWERTVADTRVHGTTRRQVGHAFEAERPTLQPLPLERFAFFHEGRRIVHRDGHVEVQRAYYTVPPEYLSHQVWVRWDSRMVRIYNHRMELLRVHARRGPGEFSTDPRDISSKKVSAVERGTAWLLSRVRRIGPQSLRWAEATVAARGIEGVRVIQGLLSLTRRHESSAIEQACEVAHGYGSFRLRTLRTLIERGGEVDKQLFLVEEHPIVRPLCEYQQFVHEAFQKER
jgi:transposase